MAKVGRNDPCPCGSGKKYKKCCLEKDEEQARQPAAAQAEELWSRRSVSPVLAPPKAPEALSGEERWERFEKADWDERVRILRHALSDKSLESDEAFEMLNDLREMAASHEQKTELWQLLFQLRTLAPKLYDHDFGYYNLWKLEDLAEHRNFTLLSELLEPFAQEPTRFPDEFAEVIRLLMYHGQTGPLLPAMRTAWPRVRRSRKLMEWAIDEFEAILGALTVYEYVGSTESPLPEDPALVRALGEIGERDVDRDRLSLLSLLGQSPEPLGLADFSPPIRPGTLAQNLVLLSLGWLGELHRRHGVSLAKGELARLTLMDYLFQTADREARGSDLLTTRPHALESFLPARLRASAYGVLDVGSFLELLPHYIEYLMQHRLADAGRTDQIVTDLRRVAEIVVQQMRQRGDPPSIVRAVERAWRDTAVTGEGEIRHDAVGLDELLAELKQIGQYPDQDLLDRIRTRGASAVPPLIAMATDQSLHEADQDSPEVWAPLHAIEILGDMGAEEAVEPLLPLLSWDDDWLGELLPQSFGGIGRPALGPMRGLLSDRNKDIWTRARAATALARMAQRHPDLRAEAVEPLVEHIDTSGADSGDEAELNGFIVSDLVDIQAREALPAIERAFREARVDEFVIGLDSVQRQLTGTGET